MVSFLKALRFHVVVEIPKAESGNLFQIIVYLRPLTIVPAIIVGTIVTMCITVRKIERMILTCGTSVLRLRAHQR